MRLPMQSQPVQRNIPSQPVADRRSCGAAHGGRGVQPSDVVSGTLSTKLLGQGHQAANSYTDSHLSHAYAVSLSLTSVRDGVLEVLSRLSQHVQSEEPAMRLSMQSQPVKRTIPSQPCAFRDTGGEQGVASGGCGVHPSSLEEL